MTRKATIARYLKQLRKLDAGTWLLAMETGLLVFAMVLTMVAPIAPAVPIFHGAAADEALCRSNFLQAA